MLRELVDALAENQESLKRGVLHAQLADWNARLAALGNVENDKQISVVLAECSDRVAGGEVALLDKLAPDLDKMKDLNRLIQDLGDLAAFRGDLSLLQSGASEWKRRPEIYETLMKNEFPRKLETFEQIVQTLRSINFDHFLQR